MALLKKQYGRPKRPATTDPFELVLWENVAYLASPARRQEAWDALRKTVGTRPSDILAADQEALCAITARGILKDTFAARLQECARIALDRFDGDLGRALRQPPAAARRALRAFPGIGAPGAEKILLFSGREAVLAPESNGLRVLVRLGFVGEGPYARMYAASREAALTLPRRPAALLEAHLLLQHHGRTLCKHSRPLCPACPLERLCQHARRSAATGRSRS